MTIVVFYFIEYVWEGCWFIAVVILQAVISVAVKLPLIICRFHFFELSLRVTIRVNKQSDSILLMKAGEGVLDSFYLGVVIKLASKYELRSFKSG